MSNPNRITKGEAIAGALISETSITGEDLIASDDLTVADDATIGDDLTVTDLTTTGRLAVGAGTTIKKIDSSTATVAQTIIGAGNKESATFTLTGAAVGDIVIVEPPTGLDQNLIVSDIGVFSADTVTIKLYNKDNDPKDAGGTYRYLWFDLT
jgi:hypothetical protein